MIIDYVDLDKIATSSHHEAFISSLKSFLFNNSGTQKYADKLFYTAPLYHQIFPSLKKLVFMDVGKINEELYICTMYLIYLNC